MDKVETNLLHWVWGFKTKYNRMPERLPAPFINFKLVSCSVADYQLADEPDTMEFTYRLGDVCVDIVVEYEIKAPRMTLTWKPTTVIRWELNK